MTQNTRHQAPPLPCASSAAMTETLPEAQSVLVARHPCYSQEAHHFYARMHVAVAPRCNIQCKYCNRKFDCVNESRPGVTSELLSPEEASAKVLAVGGILKQVTVVGVAGPGDPLANADKTFETFSRVRSEAPDMQLCLSTNGLTLLDHLDSIEALGIHHVTVTVNAVDPAVGQHIYKFVRWQGRTLRGLPAAQLLWDNQRRGIEELINRGVLVKVNSVLIPDVNDAHMVDISRTMRQMGVFLHNIMPLLIADGSEYQRAGMEPASTELLARVQKECETEAPLMRHCRQCRADAVGILGNDRSKEFTKDRLPALSAEYSVRARAEAHARIDERIERRRKLIEEKQWFASLSRMSSLQPFLAAVATTGDGVVNEHFGHAKEFQIYRVSQGGIQFMTTRKMDEYCSHDADCSEHGDRLESVCKLLEDCEYLLCLRIGPDPSARLTSTGITPIMTYGMIEKALHQTALQRVEQSAEEGVGG